VDFSLPSGGAGGRLLVQADLQSACMEYKDLQSDNGNGITNADIQGDGVFNPVEQLATGGLGLKIIHYPLFIIHYPVRGKNYPLSTIH
jgi:hypothetical protein